MPADDASELLRTEENLPISAGSSLMNIKFLADENFPFDVVHALRTAGYDVTWIRADALAALTDKLATAAN